MDYDTRGYRGRGRGRGYGYGFRYRGGRGGRWGPMMMPQNYVNPMAVKRERDRAERSLYVRGFPSGTTPEQLQEVFEKQGPVENMMLNMDKAKGMYALVVFEEKESIDKIFAEDAVMMGDAELQLEGKKARFDVLKENRKLKREIVRNPENAVYIKGFEDGTSQDAIKDFFSTHGTVTGVVSRQAGPNKEHFYYVVFENKEDAEKVIAMGVLKYGETELIVDAKKTREEMLEIRKAEMDHSVYVHGFDEDATEEQLVELFKTAGSIEKVYMDKGKKGAYAFVEFLNAEAVDKAVALEELKIGETPISVKKREMRQREKRKLPRRAYFERSKPVIDHNELITKLKGADNLEHQMKLVEAELQLTEEDVKQREEIVGKLEEIFLDFFPGSQILQFGSSVNGFGVRGCDMDLFLEMNLEQELTPEQLEGYPKKPAPYVADILTLKVEDGMVTRESLKEASPTDKIRLVQRILNNIEECEFNNFLSIRSARCPVIKFIHTPSETRCDLSINNRLALNNTKLLQLYAEYDPRIKTLVYAIRYWARFKDVAGNVTSGPRLTNYALYLMIFTYLNKCEPPVVPTVEQLATLADEKEVINEWDCSIQTDRSKIPFPVNNQTLEQLFSGFFEFYSTFDFTGQIISSRNGGSLDRKEYKDKLEESEDERLKHTRFSAIVVLDPFVLNHNTSANVNGRTRGRISFEFAQADAKFKHDRIFKMSSPIDVDWGLPFLMARDRIRTRTQAAVNELQHYKISLLQVAPYNLPISMKVSQLPPALLQGGPDTDEFKDRWCLEITQFIQRCLAELLLCDLQDANDLLHEQQEMESATDETNGVMNENGKRESAETDLEIETKRLKLEKLDPNAIVSALKCSTRYRMWSNRKSLKKEIKAATNESDEYLLEAEVTRHMAQVNPPSLDSIIEYYLTFSKETCSGITMLRLNMYPTIGAKEFTCFFTFLSAFVAKVVDKSFSMNI